MLAEIVPRVRLPQSARSGIPIVHQVPRSRTSSVAIVRRVTRTSTTRVHRYRLIDVGVLMVSSAVHADGLLSLIFLGLSLKIFDLLLRDVSGHSLYGIDSALTVVNLPPLMRYPSRPCEVSLNLTTESKLVPGANMALLWHEDRGSTAAVGERCVWKDRNPTPTTPAGMMLLGACWLGDDEDHLNVWRMLPVEGGTVDTGIACFCFSILRQCSSRRGTDGGGLYHMRLAEQLRLFCWSPPTSTVTQRTTYNACVKLRRTIGRRKSAEGACDWPHSVKYLPTLIGRTLRLIASL